jgi:ABC-type antimicrobial peptide transport system permease subunit
MDEILSRSTAGREFKMVLLTTFGGLAVVLAAIGIYAFIAYAVQQRTHEVGVRLALGAHSSDVRIMVVFGGMRLALIGVCVGMAGTFGLTWLIAGFLFGVRVYDPIVFITLSVALSAVALSAVWLSVRHASRIDPVEALLYQQ